MEDFLLTYIDTWGEPRLLGSIGALVGVVFGIAAQRSKFCMRAAVVELVEGTPGARLIVWLLAFLAALAATQAIVALNLVDLSQARQLAATGSVSGALIGGAMFGVGMILARGCASRLLILAASGNLRAVVTGLVLTLVAQSALSGVLAPAREALAMLWTLEGGAHRSLVGSTGLSGAWFVVLAAAGLVALWSIARHRRLASGALMVGGVVVGLVVAAGWGVTALVAHHSFEIVPLSSVTFTGPSSDTLMALVGMRSVPITFALGLVPGVALGAFLAALVSREFRIDRFGPDTPMERYLIGATLMGFGSMLAGGCAVGAVLSGGALLSITALLAGVAMWAGAGLTYLVISRSSLLPITP